MTATKVKTVLAIDDEPQMLDILKTILQEHGYNVLAARNEQESIQLYRQRWREIDVVLLDFMMPSMTGDQVLDRLKEINPRVTVLVVSGSADAPRQTVLRGKGVRGFVHKPFRLDELVRQVNAVTGNP